MFLLYIAKCVHIGNFWEQVVNSINKFIMKRCLPIIYVTSMYNISTLCTSILLHMPLSSRKNATHYFYNDKVTITDNKLVSYSEDYNTYKLNT